MNLQNVNFIVGNSYRMSWGRTVVEYTCTEEWFYEIRVFVNKLLKNEKVAVITHKDLPGSMRCYAGFPNNGGIGITVTCIETNEVVFKGPVKERKKRVIIDATV